jgi:hypothetical protein
MNKLHVILAYTIATFISVTAYEFYQGYLYDYNFGFAILGFQAIMFIVLRFVYPFIESKVLRTLHITDEVGDVSIKETLHRQFLPVIYLGISSCIKFSLMLPFLHNLHSSLLFIIFFSLSGLAKVPFAVWVFKDEIVNPRVYWIGLLIATIGSIAYSINPASPQNLFNHDEGLLLLMALIKTPFEIFDSILERYITTKKVSLERTVSVKSVGEIKSFITIFFGLFMGLWLYFNEFNLSILPNERQWIGILWIGVIVTIAFTLSSRLVVEITHAVSQPIQSIRPLFGFIPLVIFYLSNGGNSQDLMYKFLCIIIILTGVWLCLKYGNPLKKIKTEI